MTREQIERCNKYEQAFRWAIRSSFLRLSQAEFNEIASIYKDVFGKEVTKGERTCNTCRLRIMKELGQKFLNDRDAMVKAEREEEEKNNKEEESKPKNKGGRPKKLNID